MSIKEFRTKLMRLLITVPDWVRFNPSFVKAAHKLSAHIPFFLPHHKDYYGFIHLAKSKRGLFVDVGANDGISALGFRQINKNYHILSIEPNRLHEPALQAVARRIKRFDYKIVAAGRKMSQKNLYIPVSRGIRFDPVASLNFNFVKHTSKFYFGSQKIAYTRQVVNVIPLDKLKLHPDIIKIDTEGYDLEVLFGLKQTIRIYRPYLMIECIPKILEKEMKLFRTLSYSMFVYDYRRDVFSPFRERFQQTKNFGNIFCIPREKIQTLPIVPIP